MRTLAVLWVAGWAIFGLPWTDFTTEPQLHRIRWTPLTVTGLRDQARNVAYYVPFGFVAVRSGVTPPAAFGAGALFSLATEVAQIFSTSRFPSARDVTWNTAGTLAGIVLARGLWWRRTAASGRT